jgi:hypothetical protein
VEFNGIDVDKPSDATTSLFTFIVAKALRAVGETVTAVGPIIKVIG